jgi:serine/threonine protein kinase/tetratricopeptide (TPR) repeat protein
MPADILSSLHSALGAGYRIAGELAGGGLARVFLAEDLATGHKVVVKVLASDLASALDLKRFRREIQLTAQLEHPSIVPLLDSGSAGELYYYVMPFVEGETLRARLSRERQLPVPLALRIARDVAAALAYAHARNILHRDIKPENILLDRSGHALVADFGIARAIEQATDITAVTSTGMTLGTPTYMSPEQGAAEPVLDGRSDLYSLGCVLYEMLGGQPPFSGPTAPAVIARHIKEPPPPLRFVRPDLPSGVTRIVERLLAKAPADRYRAPQLVSAIDACLASFDAPPAPERRPLWPRWLYTASLGALAILSLLALLARNRTAKQATAVAPGVDSRRIAVLYLEAPSGDSTLQALGHWLTRDLILALSAVAELAVVSEEGIRQIAAGADLAEVVRQLRVGTVVTGYLERRGDSVAVDARLVDAASLQQRGATRVVYDAARAVQLRDTVVRLVAVGLRRHLGPVVRLQEWRAATRSERAWVLRQQAQDLVEESDSVGALSAQLQTSIWDRADTLLALAAQEDPNWAEPVVARGWLRSRRPSLNSRLQASALLDSGLLLAGEALRREPGNAAALALRGTLLLQGWGAVSGAPSWYLDSARAALVRATTINPRLAQAWNGLSQVLQMQGAIDAAVAAVRKALAADIYLQDTPVILNRLIVAYLFAGQPDSARTLCFEALQQFASNRVLGACELTVLGWSGSGAADIRRTWELVSMVERGGFWPLVGEISPEGRFFAAAVLARSGLAESAKAVVQETRKQLVAAGAPAANPLGEAYALLLAGAREEALAALERGAVADPTVRDRAARLPWFAALRNEPRFQRLVSAR